MGLEVGWSLWKLGERHCQFHLLQMRGDFLARKDLPCPGVGLRRASIPAAQVPTCQQ